MGGVSRAGIQYVGLAIIGVVVAGALGYCTGREDGKAAADLKRHEEGARVAREARAVTADAATRAVERVEAGRPAVTRAHALAVIVGPTTVEIRVTPSSAPTRAEVPLQVVARMVEDSLHIQRLEVAVDSLQALVIADSVLIANQDSVITDLKKLKTPRCRAKCGAAITLGAIVAGGVVAKNADQIISLLKNLFR